MIAIMIATSLKQAIKGTLSIKKETTETYLK